MKSKFQVSGRQLNMMRQERGCQLWFGYHIDVDVDN